MRRDVFQAIADPTRREIISLLASQQLNQNPVADNFDNSKLTCTGWRFSFTFAGRKYPNTSGY
jgi:DNA-binding transcriptional ArsR family regulator